MEVETGAGIITEMGLGLTDITMVETDRVLTKREPQHRAFYVTKKLWSERFYYVAMAGYLNWRLRGRLFIYSEQDLFSPFPFVRR